MLPVSFPNRFGVSGFRYTGSIAERPDGNPIENLGVTPDVLYKPTEEDLQNGYQGFAAAIHSTLKTMLSAQ